MRTHLTLILCASMLVSCGTQDYAKRPEEPGTPKARTVTPQSTPLPVRPPLLSSGQHNKGHLWGAMRWFGLSNQTVENLRCSYGDRGGVHDFNAFGASFVGGAVIGVVVRYSGSLFFGSPANDGHGHGPDGGSAVGGAVGSLHARSFWNRIYRASDHVIGAGLSAGAFVGGCQALLAGTKFPPWDGLLGNDYSAFSSAVAVALATGVAVSPWVYKAFGEAPPRIPKPSSFISQPPPSDGDGVTPKPTMTQRLANMPARIKNWSEESGFSNGFWYRLMPGVVVLGVSNSVGMIVYDRLYNDDLAREHGYPLPVGCDIKANAQN